MLIYPALVIALIVNGLYLPVTSMGDTGPLTMEPRAANVQYWTDGQEVWAHNFLAGAEFYDLYAGDTVKISTGGKYQTYIVTRRIVWMEADGLSAWYLAVESVSSFDTITLATCWPEDVKVQPTGRLLIQLEKTETEITGKHERK